MTDDEVLIKGEEIDVVRASEFSVKIELKDGRVFRATAESAYGAGLLDRSWEEPKL